MGKLKKTFWKEAAAHYKSRLEHWRRLEIVQVRDAEGQRLLRNRQEGRLILDALLPGDVPLVLDERGESLSSADMAGLLRYYDQESAGTPCFIIGGAFGLDEAVRARASRLLRLSRMTLPHELVRVFLLEQIYRAECILRNTPYHH